jgi:hypothetical protein
MDVRLARSPPRPVPDRVADDTSRSVPWKAASSDHCRRQQMNPQPCHESFVFASQTTIPAARQVLSERMMGLEPTTFCMAMRAMFAPVRERSLNPSCLQGLRPSERTRPNPNERPTLPFLPRHRGTRGRSLQLKAEAADSIPCATSSAAATSLLPVRLRPTIGEPSALTLTEWRALHRVLNASDRRVR